MKTIVKTAEMLAMFNDMEDAKLVSSTLAFVESEIDAANAIATFASVVGAKPSYERYEMARIRFVETLQGEGLSDDAIRQRSSRFFNRLGIDKPKSPSKSATKKAEQRAKAREPFNGKSDAELQTQIKTLSANPSVENLALAYKTQKELEVRAKEKSKEESAHIKQLRDNLREWVKTANEKQLQDAWHHVAGL